MKASFFFPALISAIYAAPAPVPAPYVVTSYVEISATTYSAETFSQTTYSETVIAYTQAVIPTATPVTNALSTFTDSDSYARVTVVEVVLPPGSGTTISYNYDSYYSSNTAAATSYAVPITYTPRASCGTQNWTFVTNVPVDIPNIVATQISAITVTTSVTTYTGYYDDRITKYTDMIAVVAVTDVAAADVSSASSYYEPYGLSYCYTPTTYCATTSSVATCVPTFSYDSDSSSYFGGGSSSSSSSYSEHSYIVPLLLIVILVPVGWILLWLLIGLWESWLSFKGLMLGKQRKRGLPYSWCCISCLFLCWVGPTYKAKSAEEQVELKEKWKAMKAGEKFKLWLKWGLRWKYPDMIGSEPEKDKRAFRQRCL